MSDSFDLIEHSRRVILRYQQPSGAFPACPTMPDYQFSWFRDGSFIAHSMLLYGERASARAFHRWAAQTILRYEAGARRAMDDWRAGKALNKHDVLRARYTYDGGKGPDDWPEFQLDGLGTWLWALKGFADQGNPLEADVRRAAQLAADYLSVLWSSPCHDLWEEFGDHIHTYTLGAIFAGLQAAADFLKQPGLLTTANTIQVYILTQCIQAGKTFMKFVGNEAVDGCLTALATPYSVVPSGSPLMRATIERIESELHAPGYGVHRYAKDTYYGAGAWLLLTAWLGWYYADCGDIARAKDILAHIERHATTEGDLPEQVVPPMLAAQSDYDYWVKVRGSIATPLLWSHAMVLIAAYHCRS